MVRLRRLLLVAVVAAEELQESSSPRYALLLAGGLRTLLVTWPSTRRHLVETNGGRRRWYLGLAASFGAGQGELAAAARHLCGRERFDACELLPHDAARTRAFYGTDRRALARIQNCGGRKICSFAFQWELVARAFERFDASGASETTALVVRCRPDTVLFASLDLRAYACPAGSCAYVPCAVRDGAAVPWTGGGNGERLVDDFFVGSPGAARTYAARWDGRDVAEGFVTSRLRRAHAQTRTAHHAVLAYGNARAFVDAGVYRTTRKHARCVGRVDAPPAPARGFPAYNATDAAILARYVAGRGGVR